MPVFHLLRIASRVGALLLAAMPAAHALTLADAVAAAVELQPGAELQAARAAEGQAIAAQAHSLFAADPALGVQHYNDGIGSSDGGREWEAGLSAPLWLPGQRAARRDVAVAVAHQADSTELERRWRVAGEVRRRMWDVIAAQRRSTSLEAALADARSLEASVTRRVEAGELARPEMLLAQREALTRAAAAAEMNGTLQLAWSRWRTYTGLGALPATTMEDEAPVQDIGADHPGLVALQSAADRAGAERDRTRSERRGNPTLSLGARHERGAGREKWNDAIAVGLDVPLGLPSQSGPARSAAEFAYTEAAVERRRAQLALDETLTAARAELGSARAALVLLRDARAAAQASLERAQAAFDLGEETLLTLLQVRAQALDAAMRCEEMEWRVGRGVAAVNQAQGHVPE